MVLRLVVMCRMLKLGCRILSFVVLYRVLVLVIE